MPYKYKFNAWDTVAQQMIDWKVITQTAFNEDNNMSLMYRLMTYPIHQETLIPLQFSGYLDKNKFEIFEGDIVRFYTIETEYQTHIGDNIPLGRYTEPIGVISKVIIKPVLFRNGCFTLDAETDIEEESEVDYVSSLQWFFNNFDRKRLSAIIFPKYYMDEDYCVPDEQIMEDAISYMNNDLKLNCQNVDELLFHLNALEKIGNIYENPELLK